MYSVLYPYFVHGYVVPVQYTYYIVSAVRYGFISLFPKEAARSHVGLEKFRAHKLF